MSLTEKRDAYKPFEYPWAHQFWFKQQNTLWLPEEVPMTDDVSCYSDTLTEAERNLLTQIFRFFTQADIEVNDCYHRNYLSVFKPTEVVMMLTAFSNMETIHVHAYSHLIETLKLPQVEYSAFMEIAEMKQKADFMRGFDYASNGGNPAEVAETLATFGAFVEGLQLFASFAILMNFPRFNKMKGMGQIVSWSIRDETLHMQGIIKLFHEWLREHPEIDRKALKHKVTVNLLEILRQENAFIDKVFEMGPVEGLTADEMKQYIKYIADQRLVLLDMPPMFDIKSNPLPWLESTLNAPELANFFEQRATEYNKVSVTGWDDDGVWG